MRLSSHSLLPHPGCSLSAAFLLALALPVRAAAQAPEAPALGASLMQMLFGLAVVIALLLGTLWLLKRIAAPRGAGAALKVLGATAVGPRERVVLVELGEEVLVLGVAPGMVRSLHRVPRSTLPPAGGPNPAVPPFAGWLKQAMERKHEA